MMYQDMAYPLNTLQEHHKKVGSEKCKPKKEINNFSDKYTL
jgi:hypothetical protein